MSLINIIDPEKLVLETASSTILANFLVLTVKKRVNQKIAEYLFLLILVVSILGLLGVFGVVGLSAIAIFVGMIAGAINTFFCQLLEEGKHIQAYSFMFSLFCFGIYPSLPDRLIFPAFGIVLLAIVSLIVGFGFPSSYRQSDRSQR